MTLLPERLYSFIPEAPSSEIDKILEKYQHEKIFKKLEFKDSQDRKEQLMARLYFFTVQPGKEKELADQLKNQYKGIIHYCGWRIKEQTNYPLTILKHSKN